MNNGRTDKTRSLFWREWGPLLTCALLTAAGLYLVVLATGSLTKTLLLAILLLCPLAVAIVWWAQKNQPSIFDTPTLASEVEVLADRVGASNKQ